MTDKKKVSTQNMIIIGVSSLFVLGMVLYIINTLGVSSNSNIKEVELEGSNKSSFINMDVPSSRIKEDEESMLEALDRIKYDSIMRSKEKGNGLPEMGFGKRDENAANSRLYQGQDDELVMGVKEQLEKLKENKKENATSKGGASGYSVAEVKPETKKVDPMQYELEQYRKLRSKKNELIEIKETIKVRASVHNDHKIFPSDRVELMLNEDFNYGGKIFKRNTILYAKSSFKGNRVLLSVTSIQHEPILLHCVDLQDGGIGMYVPHVSKFNEKYNSIMESETIGRGTGEIGSSLEQPFVGGVITSIGNLFNKKRLKNKDRVPLYNDQQMFLINTK